ELARFHRVEPVYRVSYSHACDQDGSMIVEGNVTALKPTRQPLPELYLTTRRSTSYPIGSSFSSAMCAGGSMTKLSRKPAMPATTGAPAQKGAVQMIRMSLS